MASSQVPKYFGVAFALVGIPIILWDAAGTSKKLDELDAAASHQAARTEQCMAKAAGILPDESIRRPVCECVVKKAELRGVSRANGSYDEDHLMPIIDECFRGDWD